MRALFLVQYYYPHIQSCAHLMHHLAAEMVHRGHEVILATPATGSVDERRTFTEEDGIRVLRVRSEPFRGVSLPRRALAEWRISGLLWEGGKDVFRGNPCDLVVSYAPPIFFGPLIRRLKKIWACPHYLVLRDIFPHWSVNVGIIRPRGLVHRFFEHYELGLYRTADVVGVESAANLPQFDRRGLADQLNLEVLQNWSPLVGQPVAETDIRERLGLKGRVLFLYGGNIGVAQGASSIVRLAMALADRPDVFFLLVGSGSRTDRIRKDISNRGLTNIKVLAPVDRTTYLGLVSEADVGLVTLRRELETHNVPGKILDYMYFAKPVLGAINEGNALRELIQSERAGFVCWNGDDDCLREKAEKLAADRELRLDMGESSRRLLESRFSVKAAAEQILSRVQV